MKALARAGADVSVTADPDAALDCDGLVAPGVGAFAACMAGLRSVGGDKLIARRIELGRPVLGICVGMQVLFAAGVEHGVRSDGCGVWPGTVERLDAPVLPHMGWNTVDSAAGSALFAGIPAGTRFYFVHSYALRMADAGPLAGAGRRSRSPSTASRSPRRSSSAWCPRPSSTPKNPVTPGPWCFQTGWRTCEAARGRLDRPTYRQETVSSLTLLPAVDVAGGQASAGAGRRRERDLLRRPGTPPSAWQEAGASWVHLVDLDAAFGRGSNASLLAEVVGKLDIAVEMSGGIRDDASLERALATGCARVNIGTAALEQPDWVRSVIGRSGDKIAVGLDVRGTTLAARGWTSEGGELFWPSSG